MKYQDHQWIASLIASHPDGKIHGRTRLQKEVKLLQRLGFPTDYSYKIHFYGPYSESLHADIGLLSEVGLIEEDSVPTSDGNEYFILEAHDDGNLPDVSEFSDSIAIMADAKPVVLELAATYDAFREQGDDHDTALVRLRRKKGLKCENGNEDLALDLLEQLGLETE